MPSEIVRSLAPYQSEFVDQFLTANSERQQLLIGSPGSGLTRCASEIVSRMMSQDPGRRVLILAERRMLVLQWLQQLQDSLDPALILEGSRRNLRESTGNIKVTDYLWPEGHVVVMDAWAFERFDDLQSTVFPRPGILLFGTDFPLQYKTQTASSCLKKSARLNTDVAF